MTCIRTPEQKCVYFSLCTQIASCRSVSRRVCSCQGSFREYYSTATRAHDARININHANMLPSSICVLDAVCLEAPLPWRQVSWYENEIHGLHRRQSPNAITASLNYVIVATPAPLPWLRDRKVRLGDKSVGYKYLYSRNALFSYSGPTFQIWSFQYYKL